MKIAVDESTTGRKKEPAQMDVVLREFDPEKDCPGVEAVETMCDVGSGKISLFTDLQGDPVSRIRHSPAFLMLVAEVGWTEEEKDKQIVGVIRGCVKTVTCGRKTSQNEKPPSPLLTKLAYILGLRVSPSFRRRGIATKLVTTMEQWFNSMGAEYSYMATSKGNEASVCLFTGRCGYAKFRTPSILVHPVFHHRLRSTSSTTTIIQISPSDAESLYRLRFSTTEFFPRDIDSVLRNPLSLGTFIAVKNRVSQSSYTWPGTATAFLVDPPESWAVVSIWNSKEVFRLEVRGASRVKRGLAKMTRAFDRVFPWLGIPSVPNLFRSFGFYFMYGVGGEGPEAAKMVSALCFHVHNMAMKGKCEVVVTEVAGGEPLKVGIPHWKRFSVTEDLWCIKRLRDQYSDGVVGDWTKSVPGPSIFVDPREL